MKGQSLKVTLPGELYERTGRWWWRARLPGEDKAKARPLKAPEAAEATDDRDRAEQIAVEMWEQAVRQNEARRISLDSTGKIERLKAQFLDKVRQLTEIVESANAKAQAEAQARAEIEAKLNAMIQTAAQTQNPAPPQPAEQPIPFEAGPVVAESAGCTVHSMSRETSDGAQVARPDLPDRTLGAAAPIVEDTVNANGTVAPTVSAPVETTHDWEVAGAAETVYTARPASTSVMTVNRNAPPQTGACECCGAAGILLSELEPIDSGQQLCPDCITALHTDISRIEARVFADHQA